MLQKQTKVYQPEETTRTDRSLQIVLWTIWTLAVVGTAVFNWHADVAAERPVNLLGIIIYSLLTGLAGLLVITIIELRMEPDRFLD